MKNNLKSTLGFTLIETLIYIGLLGIILGSFLQTSYQIIESSNRMSEKVFVLEEVNFLLRKIDFLLSSTVSVMKPRVGETGQTLEVNDENSHLTLSFDSVTGNVSLKRDSSLSKILNSDFLPVDDLIFQRAILNGKEVLKITLIIRGEEYRLIKSFQ